MRMLQKIHFGNKLTKIQIYKWYVRGYKELIDEVYTGYDGMLRYNPPSTGTYDFICNDNPQYSIFNKVISGNGGGALTFSTNMG